MVLELGFSDTLSLAQTIGIIGTMVLTLYFSKRQIRSKSIDQQTRVLNDLNDKYHDMAEIIMQDPSRAKAKYPKNSLNLLVTTSKIVSFSIEMLTTQLLLHQIYFLLE